MTYETNGERTKDFVKNIKTYFDQEDNIVIYDKRNIIKIVEFENRKYVVKSFKIPHLLNQFVYRFFRQSKAKRSFLNTMRLKMMDINTPEPLGYIEFPTQFLFKESFYISELFDFDFEIRAVFSDENFEDRDNILKKFIAFTYKLHQKKVYHIDYSPGNILVKKVNGIYTFSIIDVNRMKFIEFDDDLRMQSLAKLTNNQADNEFMVKEYARVSKINESLLLEKLNMSLSKQRQYLDNKKRLKRFKN